MPYNILQQFWIEPSLSHQKVDQALAGHSLNLSHLGDGHSIVCHWSDKDIAYSSVALILEGQKDSSEP